MSAPEVIDTSLRCPVCERTDVEKTTDGRIAPHREGSGDLARFCIWSRQPVDVDPSIVCDFCHRKLFVDGRDTWSTAADAIAAAHDAGWTGGVRWSLCAECTATRTAFEREHRASLSTEGER